MCRTNKSRNQNGSVKFQNKLRCQFVVFEIAAVNIFFGPFQKLGDQLGDGGRSFLGSDGFLDFGVRPFGEEPRVLLEGFFGTVGAKDDPPSIDVDNGSVCRLDPTQSWRQIFEFWHRKTGRQTVKLMVWEQNEF